jgi:hypothetical protein
LSLPSGKLALQPSSGCAGQHRDLGHLQSLGDDGVAPLALALEVRPVTGGRSLNAGLFRLKLSKLGLQILDPSVQGVDVRPVTTR